MPATRGRTLTGARTSARVLDPNPRKVQAVEDIQQRRRDMFEASRRRAAEHIPSGDPMLSLWALWYLRGVESRDLRCEALNGIMAALDDAEAGSR
jgi:hypothetical protein